MDNEVKLEDFTDEVLLTRHIYLPEPTPIYYIILPPVVHSYMSKDGNPLYPPDTVVKHVRCAYRFCGQTRWGFLHEFIGVEVF